MPPHALRAALLQCRRGFSFAALFSFTANLLQLTVSLYMMQVYDRVLTTRSVDTLAFLTLIALGALLTLGLLEIARSRLLVRLSGFLEEQVAPAAFERSLANSLRGWRYRSEALRDLREVRTFLTGAGILALFDLPWAPLFLLAIFALHPVLGLVSTVAVVVLFILAFINDRLSRPRLRGANDIAVRAMQELEANNRNAEIIDGLGMLSVVARRWLARNREGLRLQMEASIGAGTVLGISKFCRLSVQILVLATGAWLVMKQELTGGAMVAGSIILARALTPIDQAMGMWRQLVGARAAYRRLDDSLAEPPLRPAGMSLPAPRGDLDVEQVGFTALATGHAILQDISFGFSAGETLAIVGPSGAGKSTLGRLVVGILEPSAGHVRLDGADIFPWNRNELGRHIGYLPQDVTLFGGTVAENIARLDAADPADIIEAARKANVHDMILRLPRGYDTDIGESGVRLSGGQRQRIALARAIFGRPSLVVLDEPSANLDNEGDAALLRALAELKAQRSTVVFITHRPGLIVHADKLLMLRGGKLEMFGARDEVMSLLKPHAVVEATPRRNLQNGHSGHKRLNQ